MINAEQIRAARAYLDWSTADLAYQTGLTVNGLNKIERGHVVPQKDTLAVIQNVFEEAGLAFLPFSGVRPQNQIVEIWEGENAYSRLLDDIYNELRDIGGEVCIFGVVENLFAQSVGKDKVQSHIARLARCGIVERLIVEEGDGHLVGPVETYHQLAKKYFYPEPFCLYGSKLALVCFGEPQKVIVIDDARMAESVKKLFDFVWDHTLPVSTPLTNR